MKNKIDALKKILPYRWFYFLTSLLLITVMIGYTAYNLSYTPETRMLLLTHVNAVYRNEDLTQTTTSEGELKQWLYELLDKTFTYNYLSFTQEETYQKLVSGELHSDLPDHRDTLRPFFNDVAYASIVSSLNDAPWMFRFSEEKRRTTFSMTTPPSTRGASTVESVQDGRLVREFNGYFYVISQSNNRKAARYRVDFKALLERRPNATNQEAKKYFFRPMAPDNNSEWRIRELTWTPKRVN